MWIRIIFYIVAHLLYSAAFDYRWLSSGDCDRRDDVIAGEADGYHGNGLQLDEMGGVFLLFVAFVVVSMAVSIVEYCHHQNRIKGTCVPPDEVYSVLVYHMI